MKDFCILHKAWVSQGISHAGIIVAPQQRYTLGEELLRLVRLTGSVTAEEMQDRIEFLSRWG
jgi:Tfp pilus assembly protein PilZ